jgi:DNA polymerase-3 subunit delta
MVDVGPNVYLLHGEEEFGIAEFITKMKEKLGDPSSAEMNTSFMVSANLDIEELRAITNSVPFLTSHRLVIVENVSHKLRNKDVQEPFLKLLDELPVSTKLVLIERNKLTGKHWLLDWADRAGQRAYVRSFQLAKGGQMVKWIHGRAQEYGGEITTQAAYLLTEMIGEDTRLMDGEIQKLMTYVNGQRPVDVDDVEGLVAFAEIKGDYFDLIDAIGEQNGRKAFSMLHALQEERDPIGLFFGLVGHFRLLLQVREIIESGGREEDVAMKLKIHPYRAKKMYTQARTLSMASLENIFRQLLKYDCDIKTGETRPEVALDDFVARLVH